MVWVLKYLFRILTGRVAAEVERCIGACSDQQKGEMVELNVQVDHVRLLATVPPKVSISDFVETIKGRSAIRVFNKFRELKQKPYWGNHFWVKGYLCGYGLIVQGEDSGVPPVSGEEGTSCGVTWLGFLTEVYLSKGAAALPP